MRPKSRHDFAIAIICALPLEADAIEALFDERYDRFGQFYDKQQGDANSYLNGRIGKHNVVLCYMPGMGKRSAASVASSLHISYTGIELALVVGICGGAPPPPKYQEIFLGDVIIGDSVIEYDFGRQYPGQPDQEIRALLNGLRSDNARRELQIKMQQYLRMLQQAGEKWHYPQINDLLFEASYLHKHCGRASSNRCCCTGDSPEDICEEALEMNCHDLGCDENQVVRRRESMEAALVSIHIGTFASADTVMKSGTHRDKIIREENVIGFEMEGAGMWAHGPCIIIKGVCDYADSHKSKSWQAYAAATAACAAKAFLELWRPRNKEDARRSRHLMIPFGRNSRFVGRHDEIRRLEEWISNPDGPSQLAISGLGGVGKTQVALELAYRMRDADVECSIFWVPCTSYEAVEQACMALAQMVGIQDVKPAEVKERIKSYFCQYNGKWLLIFDNADDMDIQGHTIFTTRNRKLAVKLASSDVIHVGELDTKTGIEFLEKSLIQQSLLDNSHAVITLLEQLVFLPLAVAQAAAYINENGIEVSDYLLLLQEQETDVVELLSEDFGDSGRYKDVQNPVAITWLISFYQVQKLNQLAVDYLSLMACVDPRNIPQSLLPQPASRKKMIDALGLLSAYSFITIQPRNGCIALHRLVHLATRNWMRNEKQYSIYITKAANRLNEIFPHKDHTNRKLWREYLPHALFLLREIEFKEQQEQYIDYIQNVGTCLDSDGRYNEAGELLVQVMETRKRVLGSEHPNTLISMNNLALTYYNQGQWEEAEELLVQVMETQKRVLGLEHQNTLTSMNNLAPTYRKQGKWDEAKELHLQTQKQMLGPEHPNTLTSMVNLAFSWGQLGNTQAALAPRDKYVELRNRVLGLDHPDATSSSDALRSRQVAQNCSSQIIGNSSLIPIFCQHYKAHSFKMTEITGKQAK
ncbi:hypothetical protein BJX63DRAFT_423883 [Aspergillus granulosus]|uniref:Kinesin light chain n=1 Tax=Aspergillus granulosus TaxID=176169 RepID=A0ABR4H1M5_9EURO